MYDKNPPGNGGFVSNLKGVIFTPFLFERKGADGQNRTSDSIKKERNFGGSFAWRIARVVCIAGCVYDIIFKNLIFGKNYTCNFMKDVL